MNFNPDAELYLTLFVMGGLAVIIGSVFEKFIFVPAWLCGWAIGLTIMAPIAHFRYRSEQRCLQEYGMLEL